MIVQVIDMYDALLLDCNENTICNTAIGELDDVQKNIHKMYRDSRHLYYRVQNKDVIANKKQIEEIDEAIYYLNQSKERLQEDLERKEAYLKQSNDIDSSRAFLFKGGVGMKVAGVYPILTQAEVKEVLSQICEITWIKAILVVLTILFGQLTVLHLGLFIVTVVHFICRNINDRYHNRPRWDSVQKNIQKFFITYLLVVLANVMGIFITVPGIEMNVFLYAVIGILAYGEGVGIIEQLEGAGHKVPKIFKTVLKGKEDIDTIL